jgi:hypothetical protein
MPDFSLGGLVLERFHNSFALSGIVQGGIHFHPSDENLSLGTPERKMPLEASGFGVQPLWNRCGRFSLLCVVGG